MRNHSAQGKKTQTRNTQGGRPIQIQSSTGKDICRYDLSPRQFAAVKGTAAKYGMSIPEFISGSVNNYIALLDRHLGNQDWIQESFEALRESAGRRSVTRDILGHELYSEVKALGSKIGLSPSELTLAVLWREILQKPRARELKRIEQWFLPHARKFVAHILRHNTRRPS